MHELKIPGVEIIIKSLADGEASIVFSKDKHNAIRRDFSPEFSVCAAVKKKDDGEDAIKTAYKVLAIQAISKYLENTDISSIVICIRAKSWNDAFKYVPVEKTEDSDVLGLVHGVFSISTIDTNSIYVEKENKNENI